MRIVIQRVTQASVTIDEKVKASIGKGYLILLGIEERDGQEDIDWLVKKVINLRVGCGRRIPRDKPVHLVCFIQKGQSSKLVQGCKTRDFSSFI